LITAAACTGPPGADGADGAMGTMGAMGVAGVQGAKGDPGDPGAVGPAGADGKDGVDGANGTDGADGKDGTNGVDGKDGVNGTNGMNGTNGVDGKDGTNGVDGKDGVSLTQTLQAILDKVVPKKAAIMNVICVQPCPMDPALSDDCVAGQLWSRGTGTKLTTGDVLTAHHVTEAATACYLRTEDGTVVGQSSTFQQPVAGRDLVHVKEIVWTAAGAALAGFDVKKGQTPHLGELVLMASFPGAISRSLQTTFGFVTSTDVTASFPGDYRSYWSGAWASDNASTNGSSGGPVFDSNGDLVAVIVGRPSDDSLDLRFNLPLIW
jgi:hypothetical protein